MLCGGREKEREREREREEETEREKKRNISFLDLIFRPLRHSVAFEKKKRSCIFEVLDHMSNLYESKDRVILEKRQRKEKIEREKRKEKIERRGR